MKLQKKKNVLIICSKCIIPLRYQFFHPQYLVVYRCIGSGERLDVSRFHRFCSSRSNFTRRLNCTRGYSDISGRIRGWSAAARNVTDSSAANCIGITLGTPGKTVRSPPLFAPSNWSTRGWRWWWWGRWWRRKGGGGWKGRGGGGGDERKGERGSYESLERGRGGREGSQLILRWQTVRLSQRRFCSSPK